MIRASLTTDLQWAIGAVLFHLAIVLFLASQTELEILHSAHDGVYYKAHLADPFLQGDLTDWDNVPYRAIRFGYVLFALPLRWMGVVPALVVVNLAAIAVGTMAIRRISRLYGSHGILASMVWILSPGALVSTVLLLPDTVAWAAILLSLLFLRSRRWFLSALFALAAVITKEASIAAIGAACLVQMFNERDWRPLIPSVVPGMVHLGLLGYLTAEYGPSSHSLFITWPLFGWVEVVEIWSDNRALSQFVGLVVFGTGLAVLAVWWRRRRDVFLAAASGQAILMMFLDSVVIFTFANSVRFGGLFWPIIAATREIDRPQSNPLTRALGSR